MTFAITHPPHTLRPKPLTFLLSGVKTATLELLPQSRIFANFHTFGIIGLSTFKYFKITFGALRPLSMLKRNEYDL